MKYGKGFSVLQRKGLSAAVRKRREALGWNRLARQPIELSIKPAERMVDLGRAIKKNFGKFVTKAADERLVFELKK